MAIPLPDQFFMPKHFSFSIFNYENNTSLKLFTKDIPAMEKLKISVNKRNIVTESGKPFFYLGETAWELFHRCTREEAEQLLVDRANKGFTVIQAVALAEIDGLNTPNSYGHRPLENNDPLKPVEEYWKHVDWVVKRVNELCLYIGFLPT